MTQDEIIEMAKQAGYDEHQAKFDTRIEAIAKLVAEREREKLTDAAMKSAEKAIDSAIALEREACAKVADKYAKGLERNYSEIIAEAIRARGQV